MSRHLKSRGDADLDPAVAEALRCAYAVRLELETAARHLWLIHRNAVLRPRSAQPGGLRRLAVAMLAGMMLVTSSGVAVAASGSAIPGDLLYPLKRGIEQAQLLMVLSPQDAAQLHLRFARERMLEARAAARSRPESVSRLVADARSSLQRAERLAGPGLGVELQAARDDTKQEAPAALDSLSPDGQPGADAPPPPAPPAGAGGAAATQPVPSSTGETATVTVAPTPTPDPAVPASPSEESAEAEPSSAKQDGSAGPDSRSPVPSASGRSGDHPTSGPGDHDGPAPAKPGTRDPGF